MTGQFMAKLLNTQKKVSKIENVLEEKYLLVSEESVF